MASNPLTRVGNPNNKVTNADDLLCRPDTSGQGITAFGAGWFANERSGDVEAVALIPMTGTAQARGATALIELLPQDESGNWPMNVRVRGLTPSRDRSDYYEMWLTKGGKLTDPCGRFTVHSGLTKVTLSVPYGLRQYDGWVVTRHGSDVPLLSTKL